MTGILKATTGTKLWETKLVEGEAAKPVLYEEPHPLAGQPIQYFVLASHRDSVLYAAKKFATREGLNHANSAYRWTEPQVFPGQVISA